MTDYDIQALRHRVSALEAENHRLHDQLSLRSQQADAALARSQERYRFLFDSMDEGFCIIEFFDGPHGPLSDYIHIEANAAYAFHAGIANVVGQKVREMVGAEADGWIELYGGCCAPVCRSVSSASWWPPGVTWP